MYNHEHYCEPRCDAGEAKDEASLAEAVGITVQNLSILKTGKARAIRFSTVESICECLECQPGDILEFKKDESEQ